MRVVWGLPANSASCSQWCDDYFVSVAGIVASVAVARCCACCAGALLYFCGGNKSARRSAREGWADMQWVAKEHNIGHRPDLFSATSTWEYVKCVKSVVASSGRDTVLRFLLVRTAYFYAEATRGIHVELPDEDKRRGDRKKCGMPKESLCDIRGAAPNWERELGGCLEEIGLRRGGDRVLVRDCRPSGFCATAHGDIVTIKAPRCIAEWLKRKFAEGYEIKTQGGS